MNYLTLFSVILLTVGLSPAGADETPREVIAEQLIELGYDVFRVTNAGDTILHSAAKKQDLEAVKLAIAYGINPSRTNKAGDTPLHIAATKGNQAICEYLVECGSDLFVANALDQTPYHKALARRDSELMTFLVEHGYQPGDPSEDYLIAIGLNPDYVDNSGNALLHRLAKSKNLELLRELLEQGYDPYVYNKKGESPLTIAVRQRDLDMVALLLQYQNDEYALAHFGDLELATKLGWAEGLRLLFLADRKERLDQAWRLNFRNNAGIALIHYASASGNLETVRLLVEYGADINLQTQSEYWYNPNDPHWWTNEDWDAFAEFSRTGDLERYMQGSGFVHPVASPLTIAQNLHPNNTELLSVLEELGAVAKYEPSVRGESLEKYLK